MNGLLRYLLLPKEVSPFERSYLAKTNRIALAFFALHVPVFTVLAWLNQTNPLLAALLTSGVIAGPALAYVTVKNPRVLSMFYGVVAMAMGALLVHFGQGPVQIEMHFYFFALIAMLALFGNPLVIITAALTVALHHLALWFVLPASVFNYDAPVWVVAVHAAFVVLESIGACYIARSFFDNVIGLENVIVARTAALVRSEADMRLVLDNVDQGFVTIDRDGKMSKERSACLDTWFGRGHDGETIFDLLERRSPDFASRARFGWAQVSEGFLPLALTLDQMPHALECSDRVLEVSYRAIGEARTGETKDASELPERFLVVVADVTAAKAAERAERERNEAMSLLERMLADRSAFLDFFEDAAALVSRITSGVEDDDLSTLKRSIHTLKGNAGLVGLNSVAGMCHELEDWICEENSPPPRNQLAKLSDRWGRLAADMERLVGTRRRVIEIDESTHAALESAIRHSVPPSDLLRMVHELRLEPMQARLTAFGEQTQRIARRLGKAVEVTVEGQGVRVDAKHWTQFFGAFVHAVRNTVDHGIEPAAERLAGAKPEAGKVSLRAAVAGSEFTIEIADDGPGIDWERIAEKAKAGGLRTSNQAELQAALFCDGISTAREVTDLSGRGVGMGALRAATIALGGRIELTSERGRGTRMRFIFPKLTMSPDFRELGRPSLPPVAA